MRELARFDAELLPTTEERESLFMLRPVLQDASRRARERIAALELLALQAGELA